MGFTKAQRSMLISMMDGRGSDGSLFPFWLHFCRETTILGRLGRFLARYAPIYDSALAQAQKVEDESLSKRIRVCCTASSREI